MKKKTIKKIISKIVVGVSEIKVRSDGYYSFNYTFTLNGKKKKGRYESDFSNQTVSAFRKVLERGWAVKQIIEQEI